MPGRAVLFHNGRCCSLSLDVRGEGEDARFVIIIDPVPPLQEQRQAFGEAMRRLGITFGPDKGQVQRQLAELLWNERGRVDAEMLIGAAESQGLPDSAIQNAIRRILLCDS